MKNGIIITDIDELSSKMGNIHFLPGLFRETISLLLRSHDYFYYYGHEDQQMLSPNESLIYSAEMSRITMRLSAVISWLLIRKAVFEGELSAPDGMKSEYRLGHHEICNFANPEAELVLPPEVLDLLEHSRELYLRVQRLDLLLEEEEGTVTPPLTH